MTRLRIGMVDLDTSHPGAFIPIIRSLGHEVTAVLDSGEVNPAGFAETFAREHGIGKVFRTLPDMVEVVDLVMIHSCNWEAHIDRARPFVEAGKAVFIDKPFAGSRGHIEQLLHWQKQGAKIYGGSALHFCEEVAEWLSRDIERKDWVYASAGCGVDEFNYGIHAFSMLHGLGGAGIVQVRYLGSTVQNQYELLWDDGRRGMVSVGGTAGYLPFYANIVTQKQVDFLKVDNSRLYQSLLKAALPYFAGETPAPVPLESLLEVELAAIAARLSMEQGHPVALKDIPLDYKGYDGASFAQEYRKKKYPSIQSR